MITERHMLDLLAERYTDIRRGTISDKWVRAEHVHSGLGYTDGQRIADYVAANRQGSTLALIGHEVKVSRADWLTELREPTKCEPIKQYMNRWFLVVPDASIVKPGELPADWGLLVIRDGKLWAKKGAPALNPLPLPLEFTVSFASAVARTAHREPLRRDAPVTFVKNWTPRCAFCGELSPCSVHQPRTVQAQAA